jgi:hypothetical protein
MTVDEDPMDIATVARDAELFEALAGGGPVPRDDDVAAMLAAWRADLVDDLPTVRSPAPPPVATPAGSVVTLRRRRSRVLLAAAAAAVALGGVTTAAASVAGPESPLWPITRVLFPDRADATVARQEAQRTIDRAREAVTEQRYADADKLLDEATALIEAIDDPDLAARLLAEVEAIRGLLPGLPGTVSQPGGGGQPRPTTSPGRGGGGGGEPGPTGGGGGGGGGGNPLPSLPLPTLPLPSVPLPSLPLPTLNLS